MKSITLAHYVHYTMCGQHSKLNMHEIIKNNYENPSNNNIIIIKLEVYGDGKHVICQHTAIIYVQSIISLLCMHT